MIVAKSARPPPSAPGNNRSARIVVGDAVVKELLSLHLATLLEADREAFAARVAASVEADCDKIKNYISPSPLEVAEWTRLKQHALALVPVVIAAASPSPGAPAPALVEPDKK